MQIVQLNKQQNKLQYNLPRAQPKTIVIDKSDLKYYSDIKKAFENEINLRGYQNYNLTQRRIPEIQLTRIIQEVPIVFRDFTVDSQNVHSSLVQNTIKNKYSKNKSNKLSKKIQYKNDIINYAKKHNKNHNEIDTILQKIEDRNSHITNIDSTEVKVLNDSWKSSNDNIKTQIINELLDAHSPGYLVCPTGVVSRIINADIVENPELTPRTEENLRKEMLHTASKIRNDLENDPTYNKLSEEKQTILLKDKLIDTFTKDYKDIISEDLIQKELDTWIDYITF